MRGFDWQGGGELGEVSDVANLFREVMKNEGQLSKDPQLKSDPRAGHQRFGYRLKSPERERKRRVGERGSV